MAYGAADGIIMHLGTDFVHVSCLHIDNEFNQRQNNYGGKSPETYMELADMEERVGVLVQNEKHANKSVAKVVRIAF